MERQEQQVWQRVMCGRGPEGGGDIRPLLLAAAEGAAVYRHLAGLLTGKQRQRMQKLADTARKTVEALKGIQILSGYPVGKLRTLPVPGDTPRRLLEKCYHRAVRQMAEYTARSMDPEQGIVWQRLADREREAAVILAELIGSMEK